VLPALVRAQALLGAASRRPRALPLRPVDRGAALIIVVNPRATRPSNRRFPLSVMAIGAALPEGMSWEGVGGNLPDIDPLAVISDHVERQAGGNDPVRVIAM